MNRAMRSRYMYQKLARQQSTKGKARFWFWCFMWWTFFIPIMFFSSMIIVGMFVNLEMGGNGLVVGLLVYSLFLWPFHAFIVFVSFLMMLYRLVSK